MPVNSQVVPKTQVEGRDKVLYLPYDYLLTLGGKGIRSKLMDAFDHWLHVPKDKLVTIKSVVEKLHNASLLVDDIEDNSPMRRGKPSAHMVHGVPSTINTANLCYFDALECVMEDAAMTKIFVCEMIQLHRGQGFELYWRDNGSVACPSVEEYVDMVSNKTGGLMRLGVKMMQLYTETNKDLVPLVDLIGVHFQIRDDYLNLASTKAYKMTSSCYTDAKGFCEDLSEGKFSYPVIHSIQNLAGHELINILRARPTDIPAKQRAMDLINASKSLDYTESVIDSLDAKISEEMSKLGPNPGLEKVMAMLREEYLAEMLTSFDTISTNNSNITMGSKPRVRILGAGVSGLTVGVLLQAQGCSTTIISKSSPLAFDADPLYTSPKAGANWRSFVENGDERLQAYDEAAFKVLWSLAEIPAAGIVRYPSFEYYKQQRPNPWFARFIPGFRVLEANEIPDGFSYGYRYMTVGITVPVYLKFLLTMYTNLGGTLKHGTVEHIQDLYNGDDCDVVVNCSGIGAKTLGGVEDSDVYPTRGQIVIVKSPVLLTIMAVGAGRLQPETTYIISRNDGTVILGGTYQQNNGNLEPDWGIAERIIQRCVAVCPELAGPDGKVEVVEHKVGLRPTRKGDVRVEPEMVKTSSGRCVLLVHNYGHGGYGYQSSWGTADQVVSIISQISDGTMGNWWVQGFAAGLKALKPKM
ncbi:hypothetical protein SmJEL517_g00821 [Synchytrium microbalum]|uniref:FAD dependent oxidoreductase domain-containing protein n=1 Tax=Synchytrium microbalum TaxID=1806994 RepID=A0A507CH85_9FUNG|nr:uncharacterized protein SmJEL517_g00821 [Synchytrium microbalum]TPX37025.1 hypothetical protein SmJEL517_g00821 [Synchytrium microbalum]